MDVLYTLRYLLANEPIPESHLNAEFEQLRLTIEEKDTDSTALFTTEPLHSESANVVRRVAVAAELWDDVSSAMVSISTAALALILINKLPRSNVFFL